VVTRLDWLIAVVAAGATVASLSPVLTTGYGFLDDFLALYEAQTDPSPMHEVALLQGRPVAAVLDIVFFSFVHTIGDLTAMRCFSVFCLALLSALSFLVLRRAGYGRLPAWIFAIGLLWLPGTQVMASWAILLMGPAAMVSAVLAASCFSSAIGPGGSVSLQGRACAVRLALAILLLTVAVCAYQPAAMVFWPLVLLLLLSPSRSTFSFRQLTTGAVIAAAIGLVAAAIEYAVVLTAAALITTAYTRTALTHNVLGKLDYLAGTAFPRAFDPWQLTPDRSVALGSFVLLTLLVPLTVRGHLGRRLGALLLFLVAVPASYLPNIVVAENWASARSLVAAFVVPLAAATLIVQGLPPPPPRIGLLIGLAIGVLAVSAGYNRVADYFSTPESAELALARAEVRPKLDNLNAHYAILRSDFTETLAPGFSYDEFGIPSTYASWVPVPFTQILAQEQTGHFLRHVQLVDRATVPSLPETTIVVDYGHMLDRIDNPVVYHPRASGSARAAHR
jgi:hypothetical protein